MASHFPSIEDFDPSLETTGGDADTGDNMDFLKREQAALGELFDNDASAFPDILDGATGGDNDNAAITEFESSFPALDNDNPAGVIGSTMPYMPRSFPDVTSTSHTPAPFGATAEDGEEPDVIREWRERQALRIQHQDEQSERRKAETIEKAQHAIDDFYENYNLKKDKFIGQTRKEEEEFLAARENPSVGGTTWERIAKLVDLSDKSVRGSGRSDKTRFRELLMSLKKDENAPGAKIAV